MTKLFPLRAAVVLGVFASFGTGASAAQPEPSEESLQKLTEMMTEADLDGDGRTSRLELNQHRAQMFANLDRNEDGVIDEDDRPRIRIARRKFDAGFEQVASIFDANKDGRITLAEWNRSDPDIFAMLDRNEDDVIDRSELPTLP